MVAYLLPGNIAVLLEARRQVPLTTPPHRKRSASVDPLPVVQENHLAGEWHAADIATSYAKTEEGTSHKHKLLCETQT